MQVCEESLAECLGGEDPLGPCEAADIPDSCEASVADYSACLDVSVDALRTLSHQTCADVVAAESADEDFGSELADSLGSCNDLVDQCFDEDAPDCCTADDECGYANNGNCDCSDQSWDESDCASQ
jgi:hypothetical protein